MRIVKKVGFEGYRFNCPHCGSVLEADKFELDHVKAGFRAYRCPVCSWTNVIKKKKLKKVVHYVPVKEE